jgi:uncharacterized protein GlcG (DUF336 family)
LSVDTSEETIRPLDRARIFSLAALTVAAVACASNTPTQPTEITPSGDPSNILTAADVDAVIRAAVGALDDPTLAVAVVDRSAQILGVYSRNAGGVDDRTANVAVSLARSTGFFSNNVAPLSSRTVRFISGIHFPPAPLQAPGEEPLGGVRDTPNAPLYGVENINRGCELGRAFNPGISIPRPRSIRGVVLNAPCRPDNTSGCSIGGPLRDVDGSIIPSQGITTGKYDVFDSKSGLEESVNPGGIPLYRNKKLIGGLGIAGVSNDRAEFAGLVGATGNGRGITTAIDFPNPLPSPGAIFIDGFRLPFVATTLPPDVPSVARPAGSAAGAFDASRYIVAPRTGQDAPSGYLIGPFGGDGLTADEVKSIIDHSIAQANITRAQVRLPTGLTAQFIMVVSDRQGTILAEYRQPDALFDAVDVVPSKARNAYYFSTREGYDVLRSYVDKTSYRWTPDPPAGQGWAITNRTIGFGGQPLFPPGIDQKNPPTPGPWFDLFLYDTRNVCTEGPGPSRGGNRGFINQNGITWFAGSAPLYKGGVLVGGFGVSGDGTEQNDLVTAAGAAGFEPPPELRVDNSVIETGFKEPVRLPYLKFPRNPEQE